MRGFGISLKGRIKNFNLPKNQPLLPLHEAIVNSIHSIEERHKAGVVFDGKIVVRIIRSEQFAMSEIDELPPIDSFDIIDNGIGFNEANMESFLESDSTYKSHLGGKGVGRFSWLKAFEEAKIESVYNDNGEFVKREFIFNTKKNDIDDSLTDVESAQDNKTIVSLIHCIKPYSDNLPKRVSTVAMHIIQHCLIYFMSEECPEIILTDDNETCNLNDLFREKIHPDENSSYFQIGKDEFRLLHVKSVETTIGSNKLYLCAHNRLVETKELDKYITNLDASIHKRNGFWYIGVLSGKVLDESVDMNRLSFSIPDGGPLISMAGITTMDQIMKQVQSAVSEFLKEFLEPIANEKIEKIKQYVTNTAPQYRHLLKYSPNAIEAIKPNLSEEKLDDELHRIKRDFDKDVRSENSKLLRGLKDGTIGTTEYIQRFSQQIEKINSANGSALAEYVAHRKVILDLLEFSLHRKDNGSFQTESVLHDLIYPMRSTSDDTPYGNHNLWLIDEKLAYCSYISSDVPFSNDNKEPRSDIMVLDNPVAVSDEENRGTEYDTIIIFELKRPMRNDYNGNSNPIHQLYSYVRKLKTNKTTDKNGRIIKVGTNTKFYLYAVCDVTASLVDILDEDDFVETPDKMGYYKFNQKYNAYIEVLSCDKILNDATKRNKILFDKLGI